MINNFPQITLENIKKIKCHHYFDNNDLNKEIQEKTIIIMLAAMQNRGCETVLLWKAYTQNYWISTSYDYWNVALNKEMIQELESYQANSYIAIHNHPMDYSFSLLDILTFLDYEKIKLLLVCTNNCKHCAAVYKNNNFNNSKIISMVVALIRKLIAKNIINGHRDGVSLLKYLNTFGIEYIQFKNW